LVFLSAVLGMLSWPVEWLGVGSESHGVLVAVVVVAYVLPRVFCVVRALEQGAREFFGTAG